MLKNKWFMFSLALFVIPFALNLVFYNQLPDVVPTHFDVNGQVDGTMPKFMGLFGMLFLCLAIHVFTCFVSVKDPKRNNIPDFMMNILFMICPVICIVTSMTIIYFGLGYSFDVGFVMNILVGVVLIVMPFSKDSLFSYAVNNHCSLGSPLYSLLTTAKCVGDSNLMRLSLS